MVGDPEGQGKCWEVFPLLKGMHRLPRNSELDGEFILCQFKSLPVVSEM